MQAQEPVIVDEVKDVDTHPVTSQFNDILTTLSAFRTQITALQHQLRVLDKSVSKEFKSLKKDSSKKKNKGNRKPSGFAKPTKITSELSTFMNLPSDAEVARTEVTQFIIKYIRDNNLQHTDNRKIITPDQRLKQLLGIKDGEEVTYFNLQKYMNKHFHRKELETTPTSTQ